MTEENPPDSTATGQVPEQATSRRFTARQARLARRKQRRRKRTGAVFTFILVTIFGLGTVGYIECVQSTRGPSNDVTKGIVLGPVAAGKYKDGITEGRSKRWYVRIRVRVRFLYGRIDRIDVLQHRTVWPKAREAADAIVNLIIEKQNTKVDAVSGATLSSQAVMLAVQDALTNNQARKWKRYEETGEGGRWDDKY